MPYNYGYKFNNLVISIPVESTTKTNLKITFQSVLLKQHTPFIELHIYEYGMMYIILRVQVLQNNI